nr:TraX family protein [uncultured Blautia sp.]
MNIYEHSLLYDNYVWMMLLSIPFILSYNGKRGIGMRYFFYLYYPLHLIILSIISFEFSVS